MGVKGLTSFIARHAEMYLTPYELHDCNLVIDGDNLACNLYKDVYDINSAFGGDYDAFYRTVVNFFAVLAECNIHSYVLMDGGYEKRKLRTVGKRMRGKISAIKRMSPQTSRIFPLMIKEVFVDAVRDFGVPVMRCVFEADDELAALSRKLNCPVLSYDSDFYIYNIKYIPLITLTVKAHTKYCKGMDQQDGSKESRNLRKNEAKKLRKRTKKNCILREIVVDNKEKTKKRQSYKYLDCCMYRIENLISRKSLSKEKLPLFAAMLGNDYISRGSFHNFFLNGLVKLGRSRKTNYQQRRIKIILEWLKTETSESALQKIMAKLQKRERESLMAQVEAATSGYSNEKCRSFDYFKNNYDNEFGLIQNNEEESYEIESVDEDEELEEEELENEEEQEFEIDSEIIEEEQTEESNEEDGIEENNDVEDDLSKECLQSNENNSKNSDEDKNDIISTFPKWFIDKLYPANLPRFFVDLVHLRKYINNPQVEHFPFEDCHSIALPILTFIYSLLNNVKGEEYELKEEDGNEGTLFYTYLTRVARVTNITHKKIDVKEKPKYDFLPERPNPLFMRSVFENETSKLDSDELFAEIESLPEDIRLYFLAIVYWLQKSNHYDIVHLHALIVCLVVLRTVDSNIPPVRDPQDFKKKFGKIIRKEREVRQKEAENGLGRKIKDEVLVLPIPERMAYIPKSDCILVQNEILKHFHMQDVFKKKYDLYCSTILHAFSEFQSVVFQLHSLNALLDFPYSSPHMGQLYCGVFLYNLYDLLKPRFDIEYYIRNFIFKDSQMMFDFYLVLWQWCKKFIPSWKLPTYKKVNPALSKRALKKKRQKAKKDAALANIVTNPNDDMLRSAGEENDEFVDLNNRFCTVLSINKL